MEVARKLNEQFAWVQESGQLVTLIYEVLNLAAEESTYNSAGYPAVVQQRSEGPMDVIDNSIFRSDS